MHKVIEEALIGLIGTDHTIGFKHSDPSERIRVTIVLSDFVKILL